jgi:hypothetical protein
MIDYFVIFVIVLSSKSMCVCVRVPTHLLNGCVMPTNLDLADFLKLFRHI